MVVGIKYCGGCNPAFDRVKLAGKLIKFFDGQVTFESAVNGETYDFLLVICGCGRQCANHSEIETKHEKLILAGEQSYDEAREAIENVLKR